MYLQTPILNPNPALAHVLTALLEEFGAKITTPQSHVPLFGFQCINVSMYCFQSSRPNFQRIIPKKKKKKAPG